MTDSPHVLPYGSWPSPISAEQVATAGVAFDGLHATDGPDGVVAWWSESRPTEGGRSAVVSRALTGERQEWLPAPADGAAMNVRTHVQEYGGGAWTPVDGRLVVSSYADSRLYRVDAPGADPVALTPDTDGRVRYADLSPGPGGTVLAVRDEVATPEAVPVRSLVAVALHGSAGGSAAGSADESGGGGETELFAGPHFLSSARVSPDGQWLTWLSWEHPAMPWDATTLWLARLDGLAVVDPVQVASGQALFQPGWTSDGRLLVVAERGDWWNLHEVVDLAGHPSLRVVWQVDAECGLPQWVFGMSSWAPLDGPAPDGPTGGGRVVVRHQLGAPGLAVVDLDSGAASELDLSMTALMPALASAGGTLLCGPSDATTPRRLLAVRPGQEPVLLAESSPSPDPAWCPTPQHLEVPGPDGRVVHAWLYPPTSPDAVAPDGELPPYLMQVHGGPTSAAGVGYNREYTYWTSRGIGVVDVDYGGSTGYGRAYRDALKGQWGVVDVEDCAAVAAELGRRGLADPGRVVISGGSAGGWTVLSCLARTDAFAAGASYFGVAELELFAAETHDFESRYLDGLIGPYPERRDLYVERAPLTHADGVAVPLLLLQGDQDKVVPPSQSERFRDAMVANGVPHAYLLYPGEGHGFRAKEAIVHSLGSELAFYGQVLGFDPPGVPPLDLVRP